MSCAITMQVIEENYQSGVWSKHMVRMAVKKGVITQEQADLIINGR